MDGYALKRKIDVTLESGGATRPTIAELRSLQQLSLDNLTSNAPIDLGNGKLRQLASQP